LRLRVAWLVLCVFCLRAAIDVPLYPGAVVDSGLTKSGRDSYPEFVEYTVYKTADTFEQVDGYFRKIGSRDVADTRSVSDDTKIVVLRFPGKKSQVQVSWMASDTEHRTVIRYFRRS
jgi:hypothetical protein